MSYVRILHTTVKLYKRTMQRINIIKCHGSGNDFILVDIVGHEELTAVDWGSFARCVCDRRSGIGSDGVLLVVRYDDGTYGMDMLNPDGTHAEMCGNGIRCVARYAHERGYIASEGVLRSGGSDYRVAMADRPIADGIATYAVDIAIRLWSKDFAFFAEGDSFVGEHLAQLDGEMRFTALNLGNPHLVAAVDDISIAKLATLGERVLTLKELLPHGVNISMYKPLSSRSIFVATYERGAGITLSCGTAMTASATAAALLGLVERGERVEVRNRGGMVYCTTLSGQDLITRLEGNATFEWRGYVEIAEGELSYVVEECSGESDLWQAFVDKLNKE